MKEGPCGCQRIVKITRAAALFVNFSSLRRKNRYYVLHNTIFYLVLLCKRKRYDGRQYRIADEEGPFGTMYPGYYTAAEGGIPPAIFSSSLKRQSWWCWKARYTHCLPGSKTPVCLVIAGKNRYRAHHVSITRLPKQA